ncbi:hypothetical protein CYMTET_31565 [Cymbomonas tetramitiformis]|uniref:Legume lectin domain-containing protein n=1 Tax=Cymbomonas tetramitiformis TaxID=36881 RepID=A0AAE0FHA6_9CHLO|nr:hypothetical protein CYMTET_31565 [Cymbomonas tetramitiformis]
MRRDSKVFFLLSSLLFHAFQFAAGYRPEAFLDLLSKDHHQASFSVSFSQSVTGWNSTGAQLRFTGCVLDEFNTTRASERTPWDGHTSILMDGYISVLTRFEGLVHWTSNNCSIIVPSSTVYNSNLDANEEARLDFSFSGRQRMEQRMAVAGALSRERRLLVTRWPASDSGVGCCLLCSAE